MIVIRRSASSGAIPARRRKSSRSRSMMSSSVRYPASSRTATVAVLEEAGYRTLDDIIDLDREDFLRLAGIAPEEADRLMTIIDELTTEDEGAEAAADPAQGGRPQ